MKKIAVIEDNENVAELIVYKLKKDYIVLRADDGLDGLALIEREKPDLVVLDIMLPRMSGFEILERVRKNPEIASVPVLMLTALGLEQDVARGFQLGANDYMVKPFRPSELLARAEKLLQAKS